MEEDYIRGYKMNLFEYILKSMPKVNWNVAKNWLDGLTDEDFHYMSMLKQRQEIRIRALYNRF